MIPRKRVEKNSTFLPKVPSTVPHLNETSVAMSYPSVANAFFSCRFRIGIRHPGLKGKFSISDSLTDNILGYATLWFPLLGSFQHMKLHIECEISPFGERHQEQGLPMCIFVGTSLGNGMWNKLSPFLTPKCLRSEFLFINTHMPLCQGQLVVERIE